MALRIASHGRIGATSAAGLGSFGRVGRVIEVFLLPIEYTPFSIVVPEPHIFTGEILAKEFVVEIVETEEQGVQVIAGYLYTVATERPLEVEITVDTEVQVAVIDPEEYDAEVISDEFDVEVIDG